VGRNFARIVGLLASIPSHLSGGQSLAVVDFLYLRLAEHIEELKSQQAAAEKLLSTRPP